jgi:hypothetical protein
MAYILESLWIYIIVTTCNHIRRHSVDHLLWKSSLSSHLVILLVLLLLLLNLLLGRNYTILFWRLCSIDSSLIVCRGVWAANCLLLLSSFFSYGIADFLRSNSVKIVMAIIIGISWSGISICVVIRIGTTIFIIIVAAATAKPTRISSGYFSSLGII